MSLHIEQREREGIVILDLKGPLTLGHGDLEMRDRVGKPGPGAGGQGPGLCSSLRSPFFMKCNSFFPDGELRKFDILAFVQQASDGNSIQGAGRAAAC